VGKGSGTTRGDRRRNARRERLRALLPRDGAVIGIDLAEDKQAIAVVDHDGRVLARKTVRVKAFRLGEALDWAAGQARTRMFAHVTVACEPTGPRWLQVQRLCAERGLPLVCIQPLVSHISREQQDYTPHKTDESDCVMIARLAAELHCYVPEELDETWAHLRHLGRRRAQLITAATASVQRVRDFLSVAWPVVTETSAQPFKSVTWLAALAVVTSRCGGDPGRLAALGLEEFTALVRAAVPDWGGQRPYQPICARIFAALASTEGVVASCRRGLLRRVADELGDLQRTRAQLQVAEADMRAVLGELGLSRLGGIPGLSATGAAAILAETGDPRRYDTSSSLVKHAGMAPAENASGAFAGQVRISRRGRPGLRLTVWRAVWPMLLFNPVMAAKYQAMTRAADAAEQAAAGGGSAAARPAAAAAARARRAKARVACAASLLRWIYSMVVHGTSWDPAAAGQHTLAEAACPAPILPAPPRGCPQAFLLMRGRASPPYRRGSTPRPTLGSSPPAARIFSPARLNAAGAGLPAHREQAEPACTT
jgi:transposase